MAKGIKNNGSKSTKLLEKQYSSLMKNVKSTRLVGTDATNGRFKIFSLYDNSKYENHATCSLTL